MPEHDLRAASAAVLLEETDLAYRAWREAPWKDEVSEEIFFDAVLPYAVVSEVREPWRRFLRARVAPLVSGAQTPGEAAVRLNREVFAQFGVRYSTERSRTDQNALEVIREGKATCTGLSVLLISACRAVGVPARLVGIPLWADSSGNHSWVEVWEDGWHFTGAAEPTGDHLDDGWFVDAASRALPGVPIHSIYATTWRDTDTAFPLAWDEDGTLGYVRAVDVTHRYAGAAPTPAGRARVEFVARDRAGRRVSIPVTILQRHRDTEDNIRRSLPEGVEPVEPVESSRTEILQGVERGPGGASVAGARPDVPVVVGRTKGDDADGNDHLVLVLDEGREYEMEFEGRAGVVTQRFLSKDDLLVVLDLDGAPSGTGDGDEPASPSHLRPVLDTGREVRSGVGEPKTGPDAPDLPNWGRPVR